MERRYRVEPIGQGVACLVLRMTCPEGFTIKGSATFKQQTTLRLFYGIEPARPFTIVVDRAAKTMKLEQHE